MKGKKEHILFIFKNKKQIECLSSNKQVVLLIVLQFGYDGVCFCHAAQTRSACCTAKNFVVTDILPCESLSKKKALFLELHALRFELTLSIVIVARTFGTCEVIVRTISCELDVKNFLQSPVSPNQLKLQLPRVSDSRES